MTTDKWASWLLSRRDGGDAEVRRQYHPALIAYRDGVLDRAAIAEGDTVLDLGTGYGLVGFGALERVGLRGRVIFSDVSTDLLDECRRRAGDDQRCVFLEASADDLSALADASVDVVTSRSVIMYLADKRPAFAEIARVLRPGGRLSIFEPINSFIAVRRRPGLLGLDPGPVADLVEKVLARFSEHDPAEAAMVNFDERDLLAWVQEAGFTAIAMDHRVEVDVPLAGPPVDWDRLKRTAPNPLVPTYAEIIAAALTEEEQARLDEYARSRFAAGAPRISTLATVYLRAVRRAS
jgi:arsenite methyltransferase